MKKAGAKNIASRIRGYFNTALNSLDNKSQKTNGKSLDQIIVEGLESDFKGTLTALAKYMPKEIDMTVEDRRAEELTDAELTDIATRSSEGINKKAKGKKESSSVH